MKITDIQPIDLIRIQQEDFDLIRETAHGVYVEVGTFHGGSALAASENADRVYTIDIYDWQPKIYQTDPWSNERSDIYFFKGTSVDAAESWLVDPIDVLFIDGSHENDSVKKDIEALEPLVKKGGIIMFHDYKEGSSGVWAAVNEYMNEKIPKILKFPTTKSSILKVQKC